MSSCVLARKVMFQCVHRYDNPDWSEELNIETFGPCYGKQGHGHNYELTGYFSGPIDSETGMIINLKDIDDLLKSATELVSGKFLNRDIEDFKTKVPTTENLILFLANKIESEISNYPGVKLTQLRLNETGDLWVDWFND